MNLFHSPLADLVEITQALVIVLSVVFFAAIPFVAGFKTLHGN